LIARQITSTKQQEEKPDEGGNLRVAVVRVSSDPAFNNWQERSKGAKQRGRSDSPRLTGADRDRKCDCSSFPRYNG